MAQIDFSSAIIEPYSSNKPFSYYKLGLGLVNGFNTYFMNDTVNILTTGTLAPTVLTNTPTKFSLIYTGTIGSGVASGTYFYLGLNNTRNWKVSNISYSAGDTFSFQLDFDITVS